MSASAATRSGGIFDYSAKRARLTEVDAAMSAADLWDDPEKAKQLGRERGLIAGIIEPLDELQTRLDDSAQLLEMAAQDNTLLEEVGSELHTLHTKLGQMEFQRMFSGEADSNNAYLNIQAGAGGTEAQDWSAMLLRMYSMWAESRGFSIEVLEQSHGEVAGLKSASLKVSGDYAYGWLRTEVGVHRLVRKSPFDSGNRRHTSFASVFVSPEVDENIEIEVNPADLRIDTYRAQGAGGQHVNTTDSAVRITHEPSGVVVQCQNQRSQHQNRDSAMKQLRSRLYDLELYKRKAEQQKLEESKSEIGWGQQIRSYVLDQSRIKDLRTNYESSNTAAVLDGQLDDFMQASLKQGL